jgi:N-acetylglucosamine-6-sulfatase
MNQRSVSFFLRPALFLLGILFSSALLQAKRPNVVFILTDDQRGDALGCMGHPHLKTPRIDRLAEEGALFRNHFCTTSLCSPSRASILGGL